MWLHQSRLSTLVTNVGAKTLLLWPNKSGLQMKALQFSTRVETVGKSGEMVDVMARRIFDEGVVAW